MDNDGHEQAHAAKGADAPGRTRLIAAGAHLLAGAAAVAAWTTTGKPSLAAGFLGMGCLLAAPVVVDRHHLRAGRELSWRPTATSWTLLGALAIRMVTVDS